MQVNELRAIKRNHRHGEKVRGENREYNAHRQRGEDVFANAVKKRNRRAHNGGCNVAASTAIETSVPPRSAATDGDSPISMWRKMFSSTMTPLSMSREKTRARPPRIMVLMDPPM